MPADGARVRNGASRSRRVACGAARRDEGERDGNSEIAFPAGRAGGAASGSNARGLQSAGKRSVAVSRFGGSAAAARGCWKRFAANQRRRGRDQSRVRGKPVADWTV